MISSILTNYSNWVGFIAKMKLEMTAQPENPNKANRLYESGIEDPKKIQKMTKLS